MRRTLSGMRKLPVDLTPVVAAYSAGERMALIAARYGVSERSVSRALRNARIPQRDTASTVACHACGKPTRRKRCQGEAYRPHCSRACYTATLRDTDYHRWAYGNRVARRYVARVCPELLVEGTVVHHVDGDQRNNSPENLMLFASQADHMRWHRLGGEQSGVVPLWAGCP